MNTLELTAILIKASQLMHLNAKVLSKDLLPQKKPLDVKAYIIYKENLDKAGEHWATLYFKDDKPYTGCLKKRGPYLKML